MFSSRFDHRRRQWSTPIASDVLREGEEVSQADPGTVRELRQFS